MHIVSLPVACLSATCLRNMAIFNEATVVLRFSNYAFATLCHFHCSMAEVCSVWNAV